MLCEDEEKPPGRREEGRKDWREGGREGETQEGKEIGGERGRREGGGVNVKGVTQEKTFLFFGNGRRVGGAGEQVNGCGSERQGYNKAGDHLEYRFCLLLRPRVIISSIEGFATKA